MKTRADQTVVIKAPATDSQAAQLQERLAKSSFSASYQEEQHGPVLVVAVQCSSVHEKSLTKLMQELGLQIQESE